MRSPKNLAGPNFATTPNPVFFRDGKMNRDPHSAAGSAAAPSGSSMGRTVNVNHYHFRDKS